MHQQLLLPLMCHAKQSLLLLKLLCCDTSSEDLHLINCAAQHVQLVQLACGAQSAAAAVPDTAAAAVAG
jgi:hypothetical protein